MEIDKIDSLEKGKLYWITIKNATNELIDRTAKMLDKKPINYIITNYEVSFNKIPKGMKLKKVKGGFIVE